jgi:hypothetical protein
MATNTALLSRRQIAALLAITEAEVRTMDGESLHPTKAADGSLRYQPEEVAMVIRGASPSVGGFCPNGGVCAAAFEDFRAGKSLADAVINLKQAPEIVRGLRAEYDSMTRTITVSSEAVAALEKVVGKAVQTAEQLHAAISDLPARLNAEFLRGYQTCSADADDFGEIVDLESGQRRSVRREDADAAVRRVEEQSRPTSLAEGTSSEG